MAKRATPPFEIPLEGEPGALLYAEQLRDGRLVLGTRVAGDEGGRVGELNLLAPEAAAALAGWLAPIVEREWLDSVRDRAPDQLRTAAELYADEPGSPERLAGQMLAEIPPRLMARALILLANSIGPSAREQLVERINAAGSSLEEEELRRRLAEETEAFAYAVAAASLFTAVHEAAEG